jgi:hypothetical protein
MENLLSFDDFLNEGSRPGPREYYAGLSKSTADKRAAQIKKQTPMEDDDPSAYKKLPGDSRKTKPSKYTKKFDQMFNETGKSNPFYDEELDDEDTVSVEIDNDHPDGFPGGSPEQVEEDYEITVKMSSDEETFNVSGNRSDVEAYLEDFGLSHLLDEMNEGEGGPIKSAAIETALKNKLEKIKEKNSTKYAKVTLGILRAVMRRGMGAWKTGHRPGAGQEQWGYARVNSFLTGGKTIGTEANPGPDGDLGKRAGLI